jgi:hypothetical protein
MSENMTFNKKLYEEIKKVTIIFAETAVIREWNRDDVMPILRMLDKLKAEVKE